MLRWCSASLAAGPVRQPEPRTPSAQCRARVGWRKPADSVGCTSGVDGGSSSSKSLHAPSHHHPRWDRRCCCGGSRERCPSVSLLPTAAEERLGESRRSGGAARTGDQALKACRRVRLPGSRHRRLGGRRRALGAPARLSRVNSWTLPTKCEKGQVPAGVVGCADEP